MTAEPTCTALEGGTRVGVSHISLRETLNATHADHMHYVSLRCFHVCVCKQIDIT